MLKLKKSVSILLALVVAFSLLTGFSAPSATTAKIDYHKLPHVQLTWYFFGDKQPDENLVYQKLNVITNDKINASVNFKRIDAASYEEKCKLAMASGEDWDIMFTSTWMNNFYTDEDKGAFYDITDLIKKFPALTKAVPDFCLASGKYMGRLYAVPNYQVMYMQYGLVVPTSIAKTVGLDKVKRINTAKELEPYLAKMKAAYPDKITLDSSSFIYANYDNFAGIQYLWYNIHDKSRKILRNDDAKLMPYYKTNRDFFLKGYYDPNTLTATDNSINNIQKAQTMCAIWVPVLKPGGDAENLVTYGVPTTMIPIMDPFIRANGGASTMNAINKKSKNPERALAFIELMNTDKDVYNTMCFGLQSKHYEKVSADRIKQIPNSGYNPNLAWEYGNQFNAWYYGTQQDGTWELTDKLNRKAYPSPLNGFVPDLTKVKDKVAQCDAVYKEYEKLYSGAMDYTKNQAEYTDKMNKAGLNDVVAELQRQVDAWAKTHK